MRHWPTAGRASFNDRQADLFWFGRQVLARQRALGLEHKGAAQEAIFRFGNGFHSFVEPIAYDVVWPLAQHEVTFTPLDAHNATTETKLNPCKGKPCHGKPTPRPAVRVPRALPAGYIDPEEEPDTPLVGRPMRIVERRAGQVWDGTRPIRIVEPAAPRRPDWRVLATFERFLSGRATVAELLAEIDDTLGAAVSWVGFEQQREMLIHFRRVRTEADWELHRTDALLRRGI